MQNQVSVIVPCYNHAPYIEQRIDSILKQSIKNFELIVLDDASTDGSQEILKSLSGKHNFVVHLNDRNSGSPFKQWNYGVRLAKYPLIWIAESDDFCDPEFLETLAPLFEKHTRLGLAYCQSNISNQCGEILGTYTQYSSGRSPARWNQSFLADGRQECAEYLIVENTIPNASAVVFRKDLYLQGGGAPEDMRYCGDWWVWAKILMQSEMAFEARALNCFRRDKTRQQIGARYFLHEAIKVCNMIAGSAALSPQQLEAARKMLTYQCLKWTAENCLCASPLQVFKLLLQVMRFDPLAPLRIPRLAGDYLFRGIKKPFKEIVS